MISENKTVLSLKGFLSGFGFALKKIKHELLYSLFAVLIITSALSTILYFAETSVQPDVFSNWLDAFVWSNTRYVAGGDSAFHGSPQTVPGRWVAYLLGIVGIALVAVPAGLFGSAFSEALAENRRAKEIRGSREKLMSAFLRKQCRHTKCRVVPNFIPVTTIQADKKMDVKDIIDAVNICNNFRLRNLAITQNRSEHPIDKLVVELFATTPDTPYGCKINRGSNITIVSTSSTTEASIGHFSYYLALFGGFNYISKEIEADEDNPCSFYHVDDPDDIKSNTKQFIDDIHSFGTGKDKWIIFLLSSSGCDEPIYPTHLHFIYGAKKGDEGYADANLTIMDTDRFEQFYNIFSEEAKNKYSYLSDKHRFHTGKGMKNIARQIGGGKIINAFTVRIAYAITVWDDRNIALAQTMAQSITQQLEGKDWIENDEWKKIGYGYNH